MRVSFAVGSSALSLAKDQGRTLINAGRRGLMALSASSCWSMDALICLTLAVRVARSAPRPARAMEP